MNNGLKFLATGAAMLAALSANAGFAQTLAPAPESRIAEPATPAMWRIADEDSEFILLGTFHILPPGLNWRSDAFEAALAQAETVYFEVDADAPGAQSKTISVVMTQGFNTSGKPLTSMLEEADAQRLRKIAASVGLPIAAIDPMRPWNAFLTLTVQFIVKQGFEPGAGVDSVLLAEARTLGKNVLFFETIEEQLALFTELDSKTEKNLLLITLRDWDNQAAAFEDLFKAWAAGDADFIDNQMNQAMREETPAVYERLIVARNKAWAETLDAALKGGGGKALVAVGAGHLVGGKNSVPGLLAAKGYEVSRYGVDELHAEKAPGANIQATADETDNTITEAANDNEPAEIDASATEQAGDPAAVVGDDRETDDQQETGGEEETVAEEEAAIP